MNFEFYWGEVDITLIIEYEIDEDCHKTRVTSDTITKTINLVSLGELPIWGKFRGYMEDNPSHFFEIELDSMQTSSLNPPQFGFALSNIPEGCNIVAGYPRFNTFGIGARELFIRKSDFNAICRSEKGFIRYENNYNNIIIEYIQRSSEIIDGSIVTTFSDVQKFYGDRI